MDNFNDGRNNRKSGRGWIILSTFCILFLLGFMIVSVVLNSRQVQADPALPSVVLPDETQAAEETPAPSQDMQASAATPAPTAQAPAPANTPIPQERETLSIMDNPFVEIAKNAKESVVGISNRVLLTNPRGVASDVVQGSGSGVILSEDGYIITNAHVIADADTIWVTLQSGEEIQAELIGKDTVTDIAVLLVNKDGLIPMKRGDSDLMQVGEFVLAIGNPLGSELFGTVTMGIVSATNRVLEVDARMVELIQTDAAINPGNSGGALLNVYGELIGINTLKFSSTYSGMYAVEGLGFAIPINDAIPIAEELIVSGKIERPVLGGLFSDLTPYRAQYFGITGGIIIQELYDGSPAKEAGLRAMDIITAIDGAEVTTVAALSAYLTDLEFGSTVKVTIQRDGKTMDVDVILTPFVFPED